MLHALTRLLHARAQNVHDNIELFDAPHDRVLLLTERGSHCTYFEVRAGILLPCRCMLPLATLTASCAQGLFRIRGSWCDRVALEYLAAALAVRAELALPTVKEDAAAAAEEVVAAAPA